MKEIYHTMAKETDNPSQTNQTEKRGRTPIQDKGIIHHADHSRKTVASSYVGRGA